MATINGLFPRKGNKNKDLRKKAQIPVKRTLSYSIDDTNKENIPHSSSIVFKSKGFKDPNGRSDNITKVKPNAKANLSVTTNLDDRSYSVTANTNTTRGTAKVLRDVKNNASKKFSNVKSTIDNFSQRLRSSTRRRLRLPSNSQYNQLDENGTPVKLYSPFCIETPSPPSLTTLRQDSVESHTTKRCAFQSPGGRFKQDLQDVTSGMEVLNSFAKSMQHCGFKGRFSSN
ncbi:uncharacterized protein LOC106456966 [Limulus polyphemus]|uniref:Uncharacterized protein LOC106456966 n=1 Tax=Limulus polyphemus TaxID=6850 RepID=A0ABM1AZN3_LIMPO|nr:uncharacterized protein LOC106456966 [Limulus polyphemus]